MKSIEGQLVVGGIVWLLLVWLMAWSWDANYPLEKHDRQVRSYADWRPDEDGKYKYIKPEEK